MKMKPMLKVRTHTHQQTLLYCLLPSLGRPVIVIDGRQVNKKWRKRTLHPIHVDNKMKAGELLVRKNVLICTLYIYI